VVAHPSRRQSGARGAGRAVLVERRLSFRAEHPRAGAAVIPSGAAQRRRRGILGLPVESCPLDKVSKDSSSARRRRAPGSE
jgi:hypothetical protein